VKLGPRNKEAQTKEAAVAGKPSTYRDLLEKTQELQRRFVLAQADLAETELAGTAGAGMVTVTMRGDGVVTRVAFDQAVFDEGDAASLGALTLAAIRQAADAVKAVTEEKMAAVSAGLGGAASFGSHY
jgi:nucleoid-associated protein EbfC